MTGDDLLEQWSRNSQHIASSIDRRLAGLLEIRTSQINGCAGSIDLHALAARKRGETEQRIYLLPAWRDAACYSPRERAALAWAEVLTRLQAHSYESAHAALKQHFTEEERLRLTLLVADINGWNRIAAGFAEARAMAA
jgi:AhpD family alkylhydroperoxidase